MPTTIIKTTGIVLAINPWSKTSHIVTWLTPDHGVITTNVKGAERPKSAFLGQYDFFYTCDLLYYAHTKGESHALREVTPRNFRENIRGNWRATTLARYATYLIERLVSPESDSHTWYDFLDNFLTTIQGDLNHLAHLEMQILTLAGLSPDFSELNPNAPWTPFSLERGRCGTGKHLLRLTPSTVEYLREVVSGQWSVVSSQWSTTTDPSPDAIRFLGAFIDFHLETNNQIRRSVVKLLSM